MSIGIDCIIGDVNVSEELISQTTLKKVTICVGETPKRAPLAERERKAPATDKSRELSLASAKEIGSTRAERVGKKEFEKAVYKLLEAGFTKKRAEEIVHSQFDHQMKVVGELVKDPSNVLVEMYKQMQEVQKAIDGMVKERVKEGKGFCFKGTFLGPDGNMHEVRAKSEKALLKEVNCLYIALAFECCSPEKKKFLMEMIQKIETQTSRVSDFLSPMRTIAKNGLKVGSAYLEKNGVETNLSEAGRCCDMAACVHFASGLISLKKAYHKWQKVQEFNEQIAMCQEEGDVVMVATLQKRKEKLKRQCIGFFTVGSCKTGSALFYSAAGVAALCSLIIPADVAATTAAVGGVLSIVGSAISVIAGTCAAGFCGRNLYKAVKRKKEIEHFMEYMLKEYAVYPGTEEEVRLALRLCEMHLKKEETKMCNSSIGLVAGSAAIIGGSFSIGAALGPETLGIGTAVCAGVGAVAVGVKLAVSIKRARDEKERQELLLELRRYRETNEGLYCDLYLQILSELEKRDCLEIRRAKGLPVQVKIFSERLAPLLLGMHGEEFVRLVQSAYQHMVEDLHVASEVYRSLAVRASTRGKEVDPIWGERIESFANGQIGTFHRSDLKMYREEKKLWEERDKALGKLNRTCSVKDYVERYNKVLEKNRKIQALQSYHREKSKRVVEALGPNKPKGNVEGPVPIKPNALEKIAQKVQTVASPKMGRRRS
jgi:hypothetical protein